jgi:hypothetical protein
MERIIFPQLGGDFRVMCQRNSKKKKEKRKKKKKTISPLLFGAEI